MLTLCRNREPKPLIPRRHIQHRPTLCPKDIERENKMADKRYLLVTGTSAEQLERLTGIRGNNTKFGVLAEEPRPLEDIDHMAARFNEMMHPTPRCTCGRGRLAIFHKTGCPLANPIS